LKWLNEPIKSTGYRKEPNLDSPSIEEAIVKDEKPEKDNKDLFQVLINIVNQVKVLVLKVSWASFVSTDTGSPLLKYSTQGTQLTFLYSIEYSCRRNYKC